VLAAREERASVESMQKSETPFQEAPASLAKAPEPEESEDLYSVKNFTV
jgi:hypothetical protein